jgi:hypothetical protein
MSYGIHGSDCDEAWLLLISNCDFTRDHACISGAQPQAGRSRFEADLCASDLIPASCALDLDVARLVDVYEV